MKIEFKLREVDEILPWGEPGNKSLSWFALSDGCYCIDTPAGRLLEHDGLPDPTLGEPWIEYQVVRLFEDIVDIWPIVRDPVPVDVERRFTAKCLNESFNDALDAAGDEFLELWEAASYWWNERHLSFGYLRNSPKMILLRSGDTVHLNWNAASPWSVKGADLAMPFEEACLSVEQFFREFLEAMGRRVENIQSSGWHRKGIFCDIDRLVAEQHERSEWARVALGRTKQTDWEHVRSSLSKLGA